MKASDEAKPQRRGSDVHREEVIVVGAGQAGLSMGYWLRKLQRSFLLLEAGPRIGESWRQRYDSLVLFTPRRYSALPGLGAWLKAQPEPVLGLELKLALRERQVRLKPRATSAQGNMVQFADGSQAQVRTVIWATGYRQDFSWIHISGALDEYGQPGAHQGVSTTPGLFFLGFPWQPSRGSALVGWVGKDARRLAARLANQRTGTRLRRRDHEPRTTGRQDHRLPSPLLIGNRLFFRDASRQRGERKAPVTRSAFVSRSEPFD